MSPRIMRFTEVLRDVARGGLAGVIAGFVVGGFGGRIAMSLAAILNPAATGLHTSNGELIGSFSLDGTLAVFMFGGLAGGLVAGMVWVVIAPWLPRRAAWRAMVAMPLAIAIGGVFLVRSSNSDFAILASDAAIIALLLGVVGLIGLAVAWVDGQLDQRLPRPGRRSWRQLASYGVIAGVGVLYMPLLVPAFFTRDGCGCPEPPTLIGWALVAAGLVTSLGWALRVGWGRSEPPRTVLFAGRASVLLAFAVGAGSLLPEVIAILRMS